MYNLSLFFAEYLSNLDFLKIKSGSICFQSIEIYFKMRFFKRIVLLIAGFLIVRTLAQDLLLSTNLTRTVSEKPLTTSFLFQSPITSTCGSNEVINTNRVCIKPQYIEGCSTYESISTCSKCSLGYVLNKEKKCTYLLTFTGSITHIKGCISQDSGVCNVCAQGFFKKDNRCILGVKNCIAYNKKGDCIQCEQNHSFILSQCRKNAILGCKYEGQSHTCKECYSPFTLNGQHCSIDQCRILNDYGCVTCECGYYLTIDRQCKPIAQGCLRYEKGFCKNCLPHYKLKGGICQIEGCVEYNGSYCKRCQEKYDLVEGECKFKNCVDWLNDQCITCNKGYGLKNGLCVTATLVTCG